MTRSAGVAAFCGHTPLIEGSGGLAKNVVNSAEGWKS